MINTSFGSRYYSAGYQPKQQAQSSPHFAGKKHWLATAPLLLSTALTPVANGAPVNRRNHTDIIPSTTDLLSTPIPTTLASHSNRDGDYTLFTYTSPTTEPTVTARVQKSRLRSKRSNSDSKLTDKNAHEILEKPPFGPRDVSLFSKVVYDRSTKYNPAPIQSKTKQEWKKFYIDIQTEFYDNLYPNSNHAVNQARATLESKLIDDPKLVSAIPDIEARVGALFLIGTPAEEEAFKYLRSGKVKVVFGPTGTGTANKAISELVKDNQTGKQYHLITINELFRGEDPRLLSALEGHEFNHQDGDVNSRPEEETAYAIEARLWLQRLLAHGNKLAAMKTELTQRINTEALAQMNTRRNGDLRTKEGSGAPIYPNSSPESSQFTSFDQVIQVNNSTGTVKPNTPGNDYTRGVVQGLTKTRLGKAFTFNDSSNALDQHQRFFTDKELVTIANSSLNLSV